jgi:hypothetical protein
MRLSARLREKSIGATEDQFDLGSAQVADADDVSAFQRHCILPRP